MNEALRLTLAMGAGLVLGAIFFSSLWWTVRRGLRRERPATWFVGSFLLRMGVALAGFYFVGREHWQSLPLCLLGFILARLAAGWLARFPGDPLPTRTQEASRAP